MEPSVLELSCVRTTSQVLEASRTRPSAVQCENLIRSTSTAAKCCCAALRLNSCESSYGQITSARPPKNENQCFFYSLPVRALDKEGHIAVMWHSRLAFNRESLDYRTRPNKPLYARPLTDQVTFVLFVGEGINPLGFAVLI